MLVARPACFECTILHLDVLSARDENCIPDVTNMSSSVVAGLQGSPTMEQTIEVMYKAKWLRDKEEALKRKIAEKLEREADLLAEKSSTVHSCDSGSSW